MQAVKHFNCGSTSACGAVRDDNAGVDARALHACDENFKKFV
jgi:hypothetical protein